MLYAYSYVFIAKDANQNQPKEEMQRARSGRVLNVKLLSPQETSPSQHINV